MKQSSTNLRRRLIAALVIIFLSILIGMLSLDRWGQPDRAQLADAIVVLGANVKPNGEASESLRNRSLHAAQLYRRGLAQHMITTGGVGDNPPAEARVAANILIKSGVPKNVISTEETSTSTWENAGNAARICRAHGWKKVIIVSEPFHLWRATRNFQKQRLNAFPSPSPNRPPLLRFWMTARELPLVLRDVLLRRVC
jgi:uncharacterized SAM-binding protein YcdF (DUF218 family)